MGALNIVGSDAQQPCLVRFLLFPPLPLLTRQRYVLRRHWPQTNANVDDGGQILIDPAFTRCQRGRAGKRMLLLHKERLFIRSFEFSLAALGAPSQHRV